ncbi:MAG: hydroxypyruvate isomerase family protein [Methylobacteriaceae bacterium]|jgi:hydroxypyruvate isomerase|nr:hydroxypyruvate isomerase family protein [Methylobacteriaceae bacterium]
MPKFAANLSMMFTEVPFLERFAAAHEAGFTAVEYLLPYAFKPEEVAAPLAKYNLKQALFNLPAGNWDKGDRGVSAIPGREAEFEKGLETALAYVKATNVPIVHLMAGYPPKDADRADIEKLYKKNLAKTADFFAAHGVMVGIEPINQRSMPGYFLRTIAQAVDYIKELGRPNIRLQFDFFHAQMEEGCVSLKFKEYFDFVGHCQLAGVPDRHEPDDGELDYDYIYKLVDASGYAGYIGCEYNPAGKTVDGLKWFEPYKNK